jgi:hypothetical protein
VPKNEEERVSVTTIADEDQKDGVVGEDVPQKVGEVPSKSGGGGIPFVLPTIITASIGDAGYGP